MYSESKWAIFSSNIIMLRKRHGLNLKEMADIMHIDSASLGMIESGNYPARMGTSVFYYLGQHFNIKPRDFLLRIDESLLPEIEHISSK